MLKSEFMAKSIYGTVKYGSKYTFSNPENIPTTKKVVRCYKCNVELEKKTTQRLCKKCNKEYNKQRYQQKKDNQIW